MSTTQQVVALVALAFAGTAAMADDITIANEAFVAQKTRVEVKAEVKQAQAAGMLRIGEGESFAPQAAVQSTVTRDQVRAELRAPKARVVYPEAA